MILVYMVLGIKSRASCMVSKHFIEFCVQLLDTSYHLLLQTMDIFKGFHFKLCIRAHLCMGEFVQVDTGSCGSWELWIPKAGVTGNHKLPQCVCWELDTGHEKEKAASSLDC